jgi:glycosyltransferase involved in cell wall biosynthesis
VWSTTSLEQYCTRQYDILLCPTPVVPITTTIPTVAVVHDLTPLMLPRLHSPELKSLFWLALQTLRRADSVVTGSRHTMNDLERFRLASPKNVRVVPYGPGIVPSTDDVSFSRQFVPYILYVGGHARHKNLPRLVAAFARLSRLSGTKLVIVGWSKPELIARTGDAVRRNGLEESVAVLPDRLTDGQLSSLYSGCRAFVYPSLYEGFGLPVLEALQHGAPVVCSGTSSLPEVGGNAAVYFDPLSTADIAAKIETILNDDRLASELRTRGRVRAQEFSWQKTADGIYKVALTATSRGKPGNRRS